MDILFITMIKNAIFIVKAHNWSLVQSVTNIFECSNIFDPNIYMDIRSYQNFNTNIFGYSFVSTFGIQIYSDICSCQLFGCEYIRIFVSIKIWIRLYSDIHS